MRTVRSWAMALAIGVVAGCSDQPTTPSSPVAPDLGSALNITPTTSLDATITALSAQLFPTGLETAAGTRWEGVKARYAAGLTDPNQRAVAETRLVELARWIIGKTDRMSAPPSPETREAAAARLVTYMAMYIHSGPTTPVPTYNAGADATVAVVSPTEETTVTTPAGLAGINVEAGSVPAEAIITISQSPLSYPGNCNGPLATQRCQYPLFYDFHIFPEQQLLTPAHVAVCHVPSSSDRRPLDGEGAHDVHDRLRLAHPAPADPADYTPGAVQLTTGDENIEILPLSNRVGESVVDCDGPSTISGNMLVRGVSRLAALVGRVISPEPLYAVDQGPEHRIKSFSPINLVDTASHPDLAVESVTADGAEESGDAQGYRGEQVSLNYAITNRSPVHGGLATATSVATTYGIYVSEDATLTATDRQIGTATILPSMVPDGTGPVIVAQALTLPADLSPGPAHIGVLVHSAAGLAEISTANNGASVPLLVLAPVVTSVTVEPTTAATSVGGTVQYTATVIDERGNVMTGRTVNWSATPTTQVGIDAAGLLTAALPGAATVTATVEGENAVASLTVDEEIDHASFCSMFALNAFGSATTTPSPGCALRLTSNGVGQSGTAWSKWKVKLSDGFTTTFTFRFTNGGGLCDDTGCGADGVAFVIQSTSAVAVGATGFGIGYSGLTNSVAIELDSWHNGGNEFNGNHVAVHTNGALANSAADVPLASIPVPFSLVDGATHAVKIVYGSGMMSVFFDGALTPTLTVPIDLANINGASILDVNGRAWIGFTGATGAAYANQDVVTWTYIPADPGVVASVDNTP